MTAIANSQPPTPNSQKVPETVKNIGMWWGGLSRVQRIWLVVIWGTALIIAGRCFDPFRAEWYYREGFNFDAGNQLEPAVKSMEQSLRLAPLETFYEVFLGSIFEKLSKQGTDNVKQLAYAQKAEEHYSRIVKISPRNPWYHNRLAEVYLRYSQLYTDPQLKAQYAVSADAKIRQAADLDKNNGLFQMSLAYLYHRQGNLDKAMELYQKVLEIDPNFMEAYFNMADIWRQRGRQDKQIELYEIIVSKNPGFRNIHLSLGSIYYAKGQLKKAETEFIEEIKMNKNNTAAYQSLGALLIRQQNWSMAARIYARILQLEPKNVLARQYLAQCYYSLGMLDEAVAELSQVLVDDPGNAQVQKNLALMKQIKERPQTKAVKTTTEPAGTEPETKTPAEAPAQPAGESAPPAAAQ